MEDAAVTGIVVTVDSANFDFNVKVKSLATLTTDTFAAAWNASAAGSLLVAGVQTAGSLAGPSATQTTNGDSEMTFVVTFNRKVASSPTDSSFDVWSGSLGNKLFEFSDGATAVTLATSGLTYTKIYKTAIPTEVVVPGQAVIKIAAAAFTDFDTSSLPNTAATLTVTAAS